MKKKKWLASSLAVAMLFGAVGCGSSSSSSSASSDSGSSSDSTSSSASSESAASESSSASSDITLTYMASQDWVMDAEIELGEKFTAETGIKVDYQIIPADQYFNLLLTKLNTNECTDLFASQAGKFDIISQLNVEKNALPLDAEEWTTRLDELAAVEVSVDGVVYGQPVQDTSAVWAVAYNKEIFDNLGLSVPTNYAEFTAVCDAILAEGIIPLYECINDGWHHTLWFTEIGSVIDENEPGTMEALNANEKLFADSPTAMLIVDQLAEMIDAGYFGDYYMDNAFVDAAKNVADGSYAMFLCQQGFPEEVSDANPDFDTQNIGYFVNPLADNQIMNMNPVSPTRFVYSGSENADAAKQYLAFLAEPENLQYMIENVPKYNYLPISGADTTYAPNIQEFYDMYDEQGTVYQTSVKYVNPQWMDIGKEITNVVLGMNDSSVMMRNIDKNRSDQAAVVSDPDWQ
ncbi:MAG: ABC transporter substrate-binding protein [Bacillota bacterium]